MSKEAFVQKTFAAKSVALLQDVDDILGEYRSLGYVLTLRQLYYQLVARGKIENSIRSYKRIVSLVSDGRLAGLIDWAMLTDRNREAVIPPHWKSPADIVRAAAQGFQIDKWADQPYHVEVMVEKDALSGVLAPVCQNLDITFTANKGYNSLSNLYEAAGRLARFIRQGKDVVVIYLGDHDPSGIDMTRDIRDRLTMFLGQEATVDRVALNMDQVEELNPPENPAKETDSRFQAYFDLYGESSWELDAIEPTELERLVKSKVLEFRDEDLWSAMVERESEMIVILKDAASDMESREHNDGEEG